MDDFHHAFAAYETRFGTPDRIELMLPDLNGILRGKWLPGDQTDKFAKGAVRLPLSTWAPNILGEEVGETGLGIEQGDPDGRLVPIASSLAPVPWASGNVAQMLVEMVAPNEDISPLSSRGILAAIVARFGARGLRPVVASELEFYLLQPRQNPSDAPVPPAHTPDAQNYDLEVMARAQDVLCDIQSASEAQGLATDTLIAEYGPGQFEVNFHHSDDVLRAADTAVLFRRLVRSVAATHGLEATFMAKPYADHPGNGMHVHASLLDDAGRNVFDTAHARERARPDDGAGVGGGGAGKGGAGGGGVGGGAPGVGPRLQHAVAGVLATMRDLQAVFAPHLNSYRRFQPQSFAPSAPDWGRDHRGAAIRLPETSGPGARLEHRICGADVNPYLAFAAILGGMLHGLETRPALPLPLDDPGAKTTAPLSHDWQTTVERLAGSQIAADILGAEYCKIYATLRRDEISKIATRLTQVEYETYLGRL